MLVKLMVDLCIDDGAFYGAVRLMMGFGGLLVGVKWMLVVSIASDILIKLSGLLCKTTEWFETFNSGLVELHDGIISSCRIIEFVSIGIWPFLFTIAGDIDFVTSLLRYLGGMNSVLTFKHSPLITLVSEVPTVITGMDVSHGSPGRSDVSSIVSM
ncbi:hypothetical protein Ancab_002424 [Ancistrocladus abbreviatus]